MKRLAILLLLLLFTLPLFGENFTIQVQVSYQPGMLGLTPVSVLGVQPAEGFVWEFGFSLYFPIHNPDLANPAYEELWSQFVLLLRDFGEVFYPVVSLGVKARLEGHEPLFGILLGAGTELALSKKVFLRGMATYNWLDNNMKVVKDVQVSCGIGLRL